MRTLKEQSEMCHHIGEAHSKECKSRKQIIYILRNHYIGFFQTYVMCKDLFFNQEDTSYQMKAVSLRVITPDDVDRVNSGWAWRLQFRFLL